MPSAGWNANARGEYWLDVSLAGHRLEVLIDTGLIDARGQVGLSLEPTWYDRIKQGGGFQAHQTHSRMTADGQITLTESGSLDAQLISPQTRQPVGPVVYVWVLRGSTGVPDRVGLSFFHLLASCRVMWELDQRLWTVEYP